MISEISVDASGTISIHDSHEQDKTSLSDDKYIIVSDDEPAVDPREVAQMIGSRIFIFNKNRSATTSTSWRINSQDTPRNLQCGWMEMMRRRTTRRGMCIRIEEKVLKAGWRYGTKNLKNRKA